MRFKLFVLACAAIFAVAFAPTAMTQSVLDTDSDLIPDDFDNCQLRANGPGGTEPGSFCLQADDTDGDGFRNIYDPDFDQSGDIQKNDFLQLVTAMGTIDPLLDLDCDGSVQFGEFKILVAFLGSAPGP